MPPRRITRSQAPFSSGSPKKPFTAALSPPGGSHHLNGGGGGGGQQWRAKVGQEMGDQRPPGRGNQSPWLKEEDDVLAVGSGRSAGRIGVLRWRLTRVLVSSKGGCGHQQRPTSGLERDWGAWVAAHLVRLNPFELDVGGADGRPCELCAGETVTRCPFPLPKQSIIKVSSLAA